MKRLFFLALLSFLFSLSAFGATVAGGPFVATAANVTCTGTTLDFNLTLTDAGSPVNLTNSGSLVTLTNQATNSTVGSTTISHSTLDASSINMSVSNCNDIFGQTLDLTVQNVSGFGSTTITFPAAPAASPAAIPTLGEWGLILLGLSVVAVSIVGIRNDQKTAVKA